MHQHGAPPLDPPASVGSVTPLPRLIDSVPGVLYQCQRVDQQWIVRFVSHGCESVLGYHAGEFLNQDLESFTEIVHPLDRGARDPLCEGPTEFRALHVSGRPVWIKETTHIHHDEHGRPSWLSGLILDIQEQKVAEVALAHANQQKQLILDAATEMAIIATDVTGTITVFNRGAERMLGHLAKHTVGRMSLVDFLVQDELERRSDELAHATLELQRPFDALTIVPNQLGSEEREWTFVRADDSPIVVNQVVTTIRSPEGDTTGYLAVVNDITQRKQYESQLAHFSAIVSSSDDAILSTDERGMVKTWNVRAEHLFGYLESEILQQPLTTLFAHDESSCVVVLQERLRRGEKAEQLESIGQRKDGSIVDLAITMSRVKCDDGQLLGFSIIARDISEKKRAERELKDANRLLQSLATTDGLTGIGNRRYFDERLEQEWRRHMRNRFPLSVVLIDVDCFKAYNDTYGHVAGDECLRSIVRVMKSQLRRAGDVLARYGGEEFAAVLPETDAQGAEIVAECIRDAIAAANLPHATSTAADHVTVSVGVASVIPNHAHSPQKLVTRADRLLYEAKADGRNRVICGV